MVEPHVDAAMRKRRLTPAPQGHLNMTGTAEYGAHALLQASSGGPRLAAEMTSLTGAEHATLTKTMIDLSRANGETALAVGLTGTRDVEKSSPTAAPAKALPAPETRVAVCAASPSLAPGSGTFHGGRSRLRACSTCYRLSVPSTAARGRVGEPTSPTVPIAPRIRDVENRAVAPVETVAIGPPESELESDADATVVALDTASVTRPRPRSRRSSTFSSPARRNGTAPAIRHTTRGQRRRHTCTNGVPTGVSGSLGSCDQNSHPRDCCAGPDRDRHRAPRGDHRVRRPGAWTTYRTPGDSNRRARQQASPIRERPHARTRVRRGQTRDRLMDRATSSAGHNVAHSTNRPPGDRAHAAGPWSKLPLTGDVCSAPLCTSGRASLGGHVVPLTTRVEAPTLQTQDLRY